MFGSIPLLASALVLLTTALSVGAESLPVRIALFGGSSSATTYLPEEHKHQFVLRQALEREYPGQSVEVFNFADNGEFIARYLLTGRYSMHTKRMRGKNIDIAILRCGINDSKRLSRQEFGEQLRRFIELLKADFPGTRIILETGFYLDYPKHYASDRNRTLNPYWDANRELATELDIPLIDVYAASQKATAEGDWDIRIRSQNGKKYPKKPTRIYWETELDKEYGDDPAWFTDVHPNPNGVRLAVETEVAALKKLYPKRLPNNTGTMVDLPQRDQAFFVEWIDCPPERLGLKGKNPDQLQTATDPAVQ